MPLAIISLIFLQDICHFFFTFVHSLLLVVFWQQCSFCFVGSLLLGYSIFWICFSVYLSCTVLTLLLNGTIKKEKRRGEALSIDYLMDNDVIFFANLHQFLGPFGF